MNRLFPAFLLGLVCGIALTALHKPRRQPIKSTKQLRLDHVTEAIETAAPSISFTVPQGVTSARIVVDPAHSTRLSQKDILAKIANFKTAEQIIFDTNQAAREYANGR